MAGVTRISKNFIKQSAFVGLLKYNAVSPLAISRCFSSLEISKNLELISADKRHHVKTSPLKVTENFDKPMVILLSWLMAKRKHIYKFANYYLANGFDVLNISITPWQLLWPTKGSQILAGNILKFLELNKANTPLILHGFSVGGYVWGEVLVKIAQDEKRYGGIANRITGQVWDSVADITEFCEGVPKAVFPKNLVLQNALKQYMLYHLKTFDKVATCHYVRASQMFHTNLVKAPAQFFLSKADPVGAESSNKRAKEHWESTGIKVSWKCWDNSPHVGHYHRHPKEYISELSTFLNSINVIENLNKIEMKN